MSDLDDIQASLASFTSRFDENTDECFSELRKSSFFDPIPGKWLKLIAEQVKIKKFAAGDCLTHEGDKLTSFYVILFGMTTVYVNEEVVGTIVGGECLGEGTFFANANILRTATVVADEDVIVAEIDKAGIDVLLGDEELMNYMNKALLLALFKKLQGANRRIQDLIG
jgi:CRP-like cAMP-binding protein